MTRPAFLLLLITAGCQSSARIGVPELGVVHSEAGRVAFIRPTPDRLVPTALGQEQATELWIADADGAHARRLVVGAPAANPEHTLASLSSPRFSPDGQKIYFLSRAWVTSDAVHVVDVKGGREMFLAPGNSLEVIPQGPFAGCLLVAQHRQRPNADGASDWIWLLDTSGREVGLAATDSDAEQRVAEWLRGQVPSSDGQRAATMQSNKPCT